MHFGKKNPNHDYYLIDHITNTPIILNKSTVERDLGILISSDLKSTKQAAFAASKGFKILGLMKRTFVSRDLQLWKTIYITYIRPHIEFAISAWSPHLQKDIETLERVQKCATKVPFVTRTLPYSDRLKAFNITSLKDRRIRGDLIQKYKLLSGLETINWTVQPTIHEDRPRRRGCHVRELVKNCNERYHFFNNRIVSHWNALPDHVVRAINVVSFKVLLDRHNSLLQNSQ